MNWTNIVEEIFEIAIMPLLIAISVYVVNLIKLKTKQVKDKLDNSTAEKYICMFERTVTQCIQTTAQTYVSSLKKQNKFDAAAQKEAFKKTYDAVLNILSEDAKKYLTESVSDFNAYLTSKIESELYWENK